MRKKAERVCVVLVVDDLGYGGTERQVVELANNMDHRCFDVHVCVLSHHVPLESRLKNAYKNLHVVAKKVRYDFSVVPRLAQLLRTLNADIVHGYLFSSEIASRLAGRLAGTEVVVGSERNANRIEIGKSNVLALKYTQRYVDVIIANSNAGAEFHRNLYGRPPFGYHVIHNGVDTERFRPLNAAPVRRQLGIEERCPIIGAFANFKKQKNHAMLYRAFKLILASLPEARLLLVGDVPTDRRHRLQGYASQLNRLVGSLGIGQRCVFLGHREDVERIYPACDITVLPSLHEGTPNVLLESMACGIPVIATNVCDNHYIVRESEVGYLVGTNDEVAMAARMKALLVDGTLRRKMGQKARNWVATEFSTRRLAEKTEAVYTELLERKRNQPPLSQP